MDSLFSQDTSFALLFDSFSPCAFPVLFERKSMIVSAVRTVRWLSIEVSLSLSYLGDSFDKNRVAEISSKKGAFGEIKG